MTNPFLTKWWPGMVAWAILYVSDYSLTLYSAWFYRMGANKKIVLAGSFELNPIFQADIDALRIVSPRFVFMLILTTLFLPLAWFLNQSSSPVIYEVVLGAMVSMQLVLHVRHLRNLSQFRWMVRTNDIRGRIEFSRPAILGVSAVELFVFSGLFLVLFAFTESVFVAGGFFACLLLGLKHTWLGRKAAKLTPVELVTRP